MPIDISKAEAEHGLTYEVVRTWTINDHEVVLAKVRRKDADPAEGDVYLLCECDFDDEDVVEDGKVVGRRHKRDPHECASKDGVRKVVQAQAQPELEAYAKEHGLKEAVLKVHALVKEGRYLGQHWPAMIYAQEVAALLAVDLPALLDAIDSLYGEERLELHGMILADFEPRFRFPREVQWMFRMMIETPLGWPNGEAGDGAVAEMEIAIHERTGFKSGKDAFWPHNWPHVAPSHLLEFGQTFLAATLARAESKPEARAELEGVSLSRLAASLDEMAARWRALEPPPSAGDGRLTPGELYAILVGSTQQFEAELERVRETMRAPFERYLAWLNALLDRAEKHGCDEPELIEHVRRLRDNVKRFLELQDDAPGPMSPFGGPGGVPPSRPQ